MRDHERTFAGFLMFKEYQRTWSFPREVEHRLLEETVALGKSTLHLYGGRARFGTRLDVDPTTKPHVVGNALYPPFRCKSFDVVIVDPPYDDLRGGAAMPIIIPAACLARQRVFWFHTHWSLRNGLGLKLVRWWACSPGSMGSPLRVLAEYRVVGHPPHCVYHPPAGRSQLPAVLRTYDWSGFVARSLTAPRRGDLAIQRRLL